MRLIRLAGAAAATLAAAAGVALPAVTPAVAATPGYVGIVIVGHGSYCVSWKSGITGDAVLNAVASVGYRPSDGLIVQIDGQPKSATANANHYWSYWHGTGSGWHYSTAGASGYSPAAGTVEGWNYIDGGANTPPPATSYAALCGAKDRPAPRPTHPATSSAPPHSAPVRASRAPATRHSRPRPQPRGGPRTSDASMPAGPTRTPAVPARTAPAVPARAAPASNPGGHTGPSSRRAHRTTRAGPGSPRAAPGVPARSAASATTPAATPSATLVADHHSSGSSTSTLVAIGLALVLGGSAALAAWRRRTR